MVRSQDYSFRKLDKVNYSDNKTNQKYNTTKRATGKKHSSKKSTTKRTTAKKVSKKPMTLKNKKLVKENCKKKRIRTEVGDLFLRLNKQSLDSDLIAIGYLFNCMFTNNPESISYDLEKIRRYIN